MPYSDFTIASLATYLHLIPQQVERLVDRGKLPGRKVKGQWQFSRPEIHLWMEKRIGLSDEEELEHVEGVLDKDADRVAAEDRLAIEQMLPIEAISVNLQSRTGNSVIRDMIALAAETGLLWDVPKMVEAVQDREAMHPTALENGVALLHPRRPMQAILGGPFLAFGHSVAGLPFGGGNLTDLFFLVCSVDDRGHLRTLARLSRLITLPGTLQKLRAAASPVEARQVLIEAEAELDS
jgi:nitrogen PTS system EIIA component